jgi:GT2 family glycosyltransferase
MKASVHVVVLNWNGLPDTRECLASLLEQTYPQLKIHVIDNGSFQDEAATLQEEFPQVAVVRSERNLGFSGGNNVGVKRALAEGADYVLLLNNDTVVPFDCVEKLVTSASQLGNAGAVSPVICHYPDTNSIWFAGTVWEDATAGLRVPMSGWSRDRLTLTEPFATAITSGCCLLASAAVWRTVGLLDERYFAYYEEVDWSSRVQNAGLTCYVIPSATLYHKVSRSTPSTVTTYLMARNRLLWMSENLSRRERLKSLIYLAKETSWNVCNVSFGIYHNRPHLDAALSKAMLIGWIDFMRGKFGEWPTRLADSRTNTKRTS